MIRFFNPGLTYLAHKEEFDEAYHQVMEKGNLILREDVERFEKNFAKFTNKKYAIGLNSGTDALYLSLWVLDAKGKSVVVPSHTFVASVQVIEQIGADIILTDINEKPTYADILMPVHIAGEILEWKSKKPIIEDACQALGNKKVGYGLIQTYSFYPAKILGCFGDGGAITTNDKNIYEEIKELRNHYKKDYSKWGINSRLDNLQAAFLNVRIKYLPEILERRKQIANIYLSELQGVNLPNNSKERVWQDFIIQIPNRDKMFLYLKEQGIETMKNEYPMPIEKLPKAKKYEVETLRIPCNENLTEGEIGYIIQKINEFYE